MITLHQIVIPVCLFLMIIKTLSYTIFLKNLIKMNFLPPCGDPEATLNRKLLNDHYTTENCSYSSPLCAPPHPRSLDYLTSLQSNRSYCWSGQRSEDTTPVRRTVNMHDESQQSAIRLRGRFKWRWAHVVDGILQVQDAVLDGVADVVLGVGRWRRDLLVRTSLS